MRQEQKEVERILRQHKGRNRAISAGKIETMLGYPKDDTHYSGRMLIKEVLETSSLPIAACSKGYFIIETGEELTGYLDDLDGRVRGILARRQRVEKNYWGSLKK